MPANPRTAGSDHAQQPDERLCQPLVPGQPGREAVEIAGKIHASFLKSLEAELSELLQTPVAMSPGETSQAPFSKALTDVEPGDRVITLDLAPARERGYLTFPASLLYRVLDILLGTPESTSAESMANDSRRGITGIEMHILREFFDVFTRSLRRAWEPFFPVAFNQIQTGEESGQRAEYGDDLALILPAAISVGEGDLAGVTADVRLLFPPFLAKLAQVKPRAPISRAAESVRSGVLRSLGDATLRLDAVLEGASIRISSLRDLAPGQILVFGNSEGSPIDCLVNNRRQFTGELVAANGRCAIQIDNFSDPLHGARSQFMGDPAADK